MRTTTAATATPNGFTDEQLKWCRDLRAAEEAQEIEDAQVKAGLFTERILLRNETGGPLSLPRGCTYGAHGLAKEVACDGSDLVDRLRASKLSAAPGEPFWVPRGHRKAVLLNPGLPEVDPASVADEPTMQDRLELRELRSFEQRAEAPATLAARTLTDLEAQRRILDERIVQQQVELERRQSHVQAAKAKTEEFLGSRSPAWKAALLAGAAEKALEAVKKAAEAEDRRNAANLSHQGGGRRLEGASAFVSGPDGRPLAVPVMSRS